MLANNHITALFDAVVEATEEAIVNALCAAETLTGREGAVAYEFPLERLQELASSS
jgi:D-aminopeptidase